MSIEAGESPRKKLRMEDGATTLENNHVEFIPEQHPATATTLVPMLPPEPTTLEREQATGITLFVSPDAPGFQCTVKQRYTDFLVNEILLSGETLHLDDIGLGEKRKKKKPKPTEPRTDTIDVSGTKEEAVHEHHANGRVTQVIGNGNTETPTDDSQSIEEEKSQIIASISDTDRATLRDVFGESTTDEILDLFANAAAQPERNPRELGTVKSQAITEKSKRTEGHTAIRRIFGSRLETVSPASEGGVISIRAVATKGTKRGRDSGNGRKDDATADSTWQSRSNWDELGGGWLHFTLYKENKDTMEVLNYIGAEIKVPAKRFQFAGTKDRRGVTVQRVAINHVRSETLAKVNRSARGWRVGGFQHQKSGLSLGALQGNEFMITLRDCSFGEEFEKLHPDQKLEKAKVLTTQAVDAFKQHGFINYFGSQRFGSSSIGTHMVGMHMLRGDLEAAVDSILTYQESLLPENQEAAGIVKPPEEEVNRAEAIHAWRKRKDVHEAMRLMPRRFQSELAMIKYLSRRDRQGKMIQEKDYQGAIMQISRNLRLMYLHAYQSVVWNTVTSRRWELHGSKVVEGDLVIISDNRSTNPETSETVDAEGEPIIHPAATGDQVISFEDTLKRARPLSATEAASGKYSISDIVLPLPGFDVIYPPNAIGDFYKSFMASDAGGNLDPNNMRRAWKEASLPGDYRNVHIRPEVVSLEVRRYGGADLQLVSTDLERLEDQRARSPNAPYLAENGDAQTDSKPDGGVGGNDTSSGDTADRIAVLLGLRLGSSQYATVALRELTKGGAAGYRPEFSVTR